MSLRLIAHILDVLKADEPKEVILRKPVNGPISPFERVVSEMATSMGVSVRFFSPEEFGGRAGVYHRDYEMVEASDRVMAFFRGTEMNGGTHHVVEAAMNRNIPTQAWGVSDIGALERIGEWL